VDLDQQENNKICLDNKKIHFGLNHLDPTH